MKRILACGTAALLLLSAAWMQASPLQASAADQPEKAQLEDAVYQQILKYQEGRGDKDGIVTEEELAQMEDLQLELENVTSLDFLGRMPALKALWLSDGSLDDLSALKQCTGLLTLGLQNLPNVTDISFVKDMNLETFYLNLDQITDAQRLAVIRYQDASLETGFSGVIGGLPCALLDARYVSLKIDDPEIACSEVGNQGPDSSPYSACSVYGLSAGETTYSVIYRDAVIHTGTIKVSERQQSDPPLKTGFTAPELVSSTYYTPDQPLVLRDGTLSKPENGGLTALEQDVTAVTQAIIYDTDGEYEGADITLHKDGTLLVNGQEPENPEHLKFKRINSRFCIAEDGRLFWLSLDENRKIILNLICGGIADFTTDDSFYAVSEGAEAIYLRGVFKSAGTGTAPEYIACPTGVMKVIGGKNDFLLDSEHVLWYVDRRGTGDLKVRKVAADVEFVGYRHYNKNTYGCVYIKSDGKAYSAERGTLVTLDSASEEPLDELYYLNDGYFHINGRGGPWRFESLFACPNYHLTEDQVLTLQYNGRRAAITNVSKYFAATGDELTGDVCAYFMRTDSTLWSYSFRTGKFRCIDDAAEPEPQPAENDINGDGIFDKKDILLLQSWLLGKKDAVLKNPAAADSDGNQILNAADLSGMKQALLASASA